MTHQEKWSLLICGCLILLVTRVLGGYEHKCSSADFDGVPKGALCGRKLADAVGLMCGGVANINMGKRRKRDLNSDLNNFRKREEMRGTKNQKSVHLPSIQDLLLNKRKASAYLEKRGLFAQQGIVCECCYNACQPMELLEYCS